MTVGSLGRSSPLRGRPRFLGGPGTGSTGAGAASLMTPSYSPGGGGGVHRHLGGGLLPRHDLGRIPGNVPNYLVAQLGTDQRLMDPYGQLTGGVFRQRAREARGIGDRVKPFEATDPPPRLIHLETVDQGLGRWQVYHRLGDKGSRQGHPIFRRTSNEPATGREEAINRRELQHADHLFERRAQLQVILLPQKGEQFVVEHGSRMATGGTDW